MHEVQKLDVDFVAANNGLDSDAMCGSVWVNATITTLFHGMRTDNDGRDVFFVFDSVPAANELTELDVLIAAHTGKPAVLAGIDIAKQSAKRTIDSVAGDARARYVTVSPGQSMTYIEKEKQSQAYKNAGYPADETGYEFVTAQKNATSVDSTTAADRILDEAANWKLLGAAIEELRLDYKGQVDAAGDINSVTALSSKACALLGSI